MGITSMVLLQEVWMRQACMQFDDIVQTQYYDVDHYKWIDLSMLHI